MDLPGTIAITQPLRMAQIDAARRALLHGEQLPKAACVDPAQAPWNSTPWIEDSWQRCLARGLKPHTPVPFDPIPRQALRRTLEAHQWLLQSAKPVMQDLGKAIANTRYFAILTNAQGVVIDAHGVIDRTDRRAELITRIGADLSEQRIGTSAIGAALAEQRVVWLHRGEHFFADTSVYSCAGAPLTGPDGHCLGMLDVTGIECAERPELRHLVAQSARSIENALTRSRPHALLLHINWPGAGLGDTSDGLVCLSNEGEVTGMNPAARRMLNAQTAPGKATLHSSDFFALPHAMLFDSAGRSPQPLDLPLWSGLRLQALALPANDTSAATARPLKDQQAALIRQAVSRARGNVAEAARQLGISRATVYRKLGKH
ncbi:MAG: helix-turn-helix domain-containing protein [Burkholderiales bacterium]